MFYIKFVIVCTVLKQVKTLKRLTETNSDVKLNLYDNIENLFTELKQNRNIDDSNKIHKYFTTIARENNVNNEDIHKIFTAKININGTDLSTVLNEILNEDIKPKNRSSIDIDDLFTKLDDFKEFLSFNDAVHHVHSERFLNRALNESIQDDEASDGEFWQPSGRRIYKGKITKVKDFPFMASIEVFKKFQCGGSIIKSDLVITAASCLQLAWNNRFFRENPAFLAVRIGSTYYGGGGEVIPVLEIYFHPSYDPKNLRHNICLCRLVRRIKFKRRTKRVKKIDIDRLANPLPLNTDGIAIVGWGAKETSNILHGPWDNRLSFSVLDIYPPWECKDVYSSEYVTHRNFCAGFFSKGGGACNHDVGGPGIVDGVLTGIISFGAPVCGATDAPTVFIKVGFYADWIDEIMTQDVPHGKQRTTLKPPRYTWLKTYQPETTTFKVEPLSADQMLPEVTVNNITRQGDSAKDLFHEFLRAMFNEKDYEQYADLIDGTDIEANNITDNKYVTKIDSETTKNYESSTLKAEIENVQPKQITDAIDDININDIKDSAKLKIIDDSQVNLNDRKDSDKRKTDAIIDDIQVNLKDRIDSDKRKTDTIIDDIKDNLNAKKDSKQLDENVLTLLYLSDNEKREMAEEDNSGISIGEESFRDLTHRSKNTSVDNLGRNEIYDIIAEAVDEVKDETEL